jgi:hypothetical protein
VSESELCASATARLVFLRLSIRLVLGGGGGSDTHTTLSLSFGHKKGVQVPLEWCCCLP